MYRILYNGSDLETYTRLQCELPPEMDLIVVSDRSDCIQHFQGHENHALVLSFSDPRPEDLQFLQRLIGFPDAPSIVVLARSLTVAQAVCVMRSGACDCLSGPVSGDVLGLVLARLIEDNAPVGIDEGPILGRSKVIEELRNRLQRYGELDHPVLITGETGSGKELAAKTLHSCGPRSHGPFVTVNCATYTDELLGSELFGSRKGAFTGSVDRPGLFESARGGTIFLDEIGELSVVGQAKLLRVIEEGCVRPLGSNQIRAIDARIVAATNRNLRSLCNEGRFRLDLFYRLNLLRVSIPALRDHPEDIPLIVRSYLKQIPGPTKSIDAAAMMTLISHRWFGNVRELQSVVLRSAINSRGDKIRSGDLLFD